MIHPHEPPRLRLAQLPTPLVDLKNLARQLNQPRIALKRDDLTGLETTGNKIRKLEYVLADALDRGADTLVTGGGYQSNHCRATAALGARLGLRVRLLLRSPQARPANEGNVLLDRLFGAEITFHSPEEFSGRRQELFDAAMDAERRAGRTPFYFPVGASIPLGSWGYIRCIHELAEQVGRDAKVDLFVPVGSSGTMAGAVLGRALCKCDDWRIVGVPICDSVEFFQKDIRKLVADTIETYNLALSQIETPIELLDGYIGDGYAIPFPAAIDALKRLATAEGVLLDPTYTSKAFAGFIDAIGRGTIRSGAVPVFLHTGGVFGLMARRDLFEQL